MASSLMKPEPCDEHNKLLDDLGGNLEVARIVTAHFNLIKPLSRQAVYLWRRRGIPFAYRACLAIYARELGFDVPPRFLNEAPNPEPVRSPVADDVPWL